MFMVTIRPARGRLAAEIFSLNVVSEEKMVARVVGDTHRAAAMPSTAVVTSASPS